MHITTLELSSKIKEKYAQFYLTSNEYDNKEILHKIEEYKRKNYNVAVFISGNQNYSDILEKIILKEVEKGWMRRECIV